MRSVAVSFAVVALLATAGCSNMNSTEQRTLTGGAIGATGGAVVGAMTGCAWCGAAIGGAAGAAGGYVYDQYKKGQ